MIDLGQIWGPKRSLVGQKDRLDAENGGGCHHPWVWSMTAPPDHPIASDCQSLIADSQSPVYGALCCNLKIDWTSPRPRCGRKGIRTSLRPLIFHRRPYVRTWKCPRKWTSSSPDVITAATRLIKMPSYQYKEYHCGDKTVVKSFYLHNESSYTGKITSLYWISHHMHVNGSVLFLFLFFVFLLLLLPSF